MSSKFRVWWEKGEKSIWPVGTMEDGIARIRQLFLEYPHCPMGLEFLDVDGQWKEAYTEEGLSICEIANLVVK